MSEINKGSQDLKATATIVSLMYCGICGKKASGSDIVILPLDMRISGINITQYYHRKCWHKMTRMLAKNRQSDESGKGR